MINKNYPIWFNFISTGNMDFLIESVMYNKVKIAYVFGYDKKLFTKIIFKGESS